MNSFGIKDSIDDAYQMMFEQYSGRDLIIIDIQRAYADSCEYLVDDMIEYLDENDFNSVLYLYNGEELGFGNFQEEVSSWIYDITEDENIYEQIDQIEDFDKGYGFFRAAMDSMDGNDTDDIVGLIKYMIDNDINDSRDIEDENGDTVDIYSKFGVSGLDSGDMVSIPDVIDTLKYKNNPILIGGGRDECLAEIEILLQTLDIDYDLYEPLVY
jgi:hypothetical protein